MALTAREWLLLPREDQMVRGKELSPHECFLLRTLFSELSFTEEEKRNMSEEKKYRFTHPRESTEEEKAAFNKETEEIFRKMAEEIRRKEGRSK